MHLANTRTRTEWGPRWRHINTARLSFNATLPRRGRLMVQARRGLIAHGGLLRQQSLAAMHRLRPAIHPAPGQGLRGRLRREGAKASAPPLGGPTPVGASLRRLCGARAALRLTTPLVNHSAISPTSIPLRGLSMRRPSAHEPSPGRKCPKHWRSTT